MRPRQAGPQPGVPEVTETWELGAGQGGLQRTPGRRSGLFHKREATVPTGVTGELPVGTVAAPGVCPQGRGTRPCSPRPLGQHRQLGLLSGLSACLCPAGCSHGRGARGREASRERVTGSGPAGRGGEPHQGREAASTLGRGAGSDGESSRFLRRRGPRPQRCRQAVGVRTQHLPVAKCRVRSPEPGKRGTGGSAERDPPLRTPGRPGLQDPSMFMLAAKGRQLCVYISRSPREPRGGGSSPATPEVPPSPPGLRGRSPRPPAAGQLC